MVCERVVTRRSASARAKGGSRASLSGYCIAMVALLVALSCSLGIAANADGFLKRYDLPRDPHPVVEEILSRPEFNQDFSASPLEELRAYIDEQLRRAGRWLARHFPRLPHLDVDPTPGWWAVEFILIMVLVIAAVAAGWFAVKYLLSRKQDRPIKLLPLESEEPEFVGSEDALAAARAMAGEGRYREALIYLFRFVLLRLDERGIVTLRQGKTNREIFQSIPEHQTIKQPLGQMISLFNRVRYGNEACSRTVFERFVSLSRRVTGGA
jgi:hypothetical protein